MEERVNEARRMTLDVLFLASGMDGVRRRLSEYPT